MSTPILELELVNETPLFLGSYDTQFHSNDAFRTQSLKGLWRWWTRALIGGVLYDSGLRGVNLIKETIRFTGELLGSKDKCSIFRIVAEYSVDEKCEGTCRRRSDEGVCNLQRVRLLTLNRDITYLEPGSMIVRLRLYQYRKHVRPYAIELGVLSLLLSLVLSGIGKMSRRCLGTFSFTGKCYTGVADRYLSGTLSRNDIKKLINETYNIAKKYCQINIRSFTNNKISISDLPPFPIISRLEIDCSTIVNRLHYRRYGLKEPQAFSKNSFPISSIYYVERRSTMETLLFLQDFFVRSGRVRNYRRARLGDLFRRTYRAWILGLPRARTLKTGGFEGYRSPSVDRRASPFIVASHSNFTLFTLLVSSDWPEIILWKRANMRRPRSINVSPEEIVASTIDGTAYFESYIQDVLHCTPERIW